MCFEKLYEYHGFMIRNTITSFVVPITPRLLKNTSSKFLNFLHWKDCVINQILNLQFLWRKHPVLILYPLLAILKTSAYITLLYVTLSC